MSPGGEGGVVLGVRCDSRRAGRGRRATTPGERGRGAASACAVKKARNQTQHLILVI